MLRYYWKLQDTIGNSNANKLLELSHMLRPSHHQDTIGNSNANKLLELSHMLRPSHHPPLQATSSHELFYLSYQKTKTKKLITRSPCDPDMLDSNIFGTWFCWVLMMEFVDHFGSISKISSRFPS